MAAVSPLVSSDGRAQATLPRPTARRAWIAAAACRGVDVAVFFPDRGSPTEPARQLCARCAVREECSAEALADSELRGIWGGLSESQRRRLRAVQRQQEQLMDKLGIVWEEPPEPNHGPALPWAEWAAVLRANPGRWARLRTYKTRKGAQGSPQSSLRRQHMPAAEYELRSARHGASGSALYGRYITPDDEHQADEEPGADEQR